MPARAKNWNSASIALLPPTLRAQVIASLTEAEAAELLSDWRFWARPEQIAPAGDWRIWVFLAGRGAGKTRAGAEWIAEGVRRGTMAHVGLIGASYADVRAVMVEGESGLKAVCPSAVYQPANRRVRIGRAVLQLISADEPDAVRGYQFDALWADEFCKWPDPKAALDMALMALRLGAQPRMLITTTPRPIKALTDLLAEPDVVVSRCATAANVANLAPGFLTGLERRYGGSALARQELGGEIIADNKNALWQRGLIEAARVARAPELIRVVVAVDPPASIGRDECGIVVAGLGADGALYVLADLSAGGLS
ncbi:MAG: terminase family protein, partial [Rhizomicrobium sp.]